MGSCYIPPCFLLFCAAPKPFGFYAELRSLRRRIYPQITVVCPPAHPLRISNAMRSPCLLRRARRLFETSLFASGILTFPSPCSGNVRFPFAGAEPYGLCFCFGASSLRFAPLRRLLALRGSLRPACLPRRRGACALLVSAFTDESPRSTLKKRLSHIFITQKHSRYGGGTLPLGGASPPIYPKRCKTLRRCDFRLPIEFCSWEKVFVKRRRNVVGDWFSFFTFRTPGASANPFAFRLPSQKFYSFCRRLTQSFRATYLRIGQGESGGSVPLGGTLPPACLKCFCVVIIGISVFLACVERRSSAPAKETRRKTGVCEAKRVGGREETEISFRKLAEVSEAYPSGEPPLAIPKHCISSRRPQKGKVFLREWSLLRCKNFVFASEQTPFPQKHLTLFRTT